MVRFKLMMMLINMNSQLNKKSANFFFFFFFLIGKNQPIFFRVLLTNALRAYVSKPF